MIRVHILYLLCIHTYLYMPCEMSPLTFFHVQELNADIVKKLPGEGVEYLSADSVEDDVNGLYSAEYLQGITPSGRWLLDVVVKDLLGIRDLF